MASREPNAVEVTPSGLEIAFYDSVGVDGRPQQRRYLVNGERLVNVTTVLNTLSKGDALLHWAVGLEREGRDWREVRDEAARRGTNTHHLLLRTLTKGRAGLADLPDDQRPYGQAAFRWMRDRQPEVELCEAMVADPDQGYAGRLDLLAKIDGLRLLIDFKSVTKWAASAKGAKLPPYDENLLQLDLYQGALEPSGYDDADAGLIVRLGPDGTYDETRARLDPERGRCVLAAHNARKDAGRDLRASRAKAAA